MHAYNNAIDFLREYTSDYDIVFFDVKMPYMNGMTAAHKLREMDKQVVILFITSLTQYAIEGYAVDAVDYVVKPVSYENFALKLARAIKRSNEKDGDFIIIKEKNGTVRLNVHTIRYVESDGHHCVYHCGKSEYSRYSSLKQAAKELSAYPFAYCNSCYLVNLSYVKQIVGDEAAVDGENLQISQSKKKNFTLAWKEFCKG